MGYRDKVPKRKSERRWKRYFISLPILSVVLVATALAAPMVLHRTFTIFDDDFLKIDMRVQQTARRNADVGNVMGIMQVTNNHDFSILLTSLEVTITSGTFDETTSIFNPDSSPVLLTLSMPQFRLPLLIHAHGKFTTQFFATLEGDLTTLARDTDFKVDAGEIRWVEVDPDGTLREFSKDVETVCIDPLSTLVSGTGADSCREL